MADNGERALKAFPLDYQANDYDQHISRLFREPLTLATGNAFTPPKLSVLLCFTNRSGSNYLAAALASTGKVPLADEVFNWNRIEQRNAKRPLASFARYCERLAQGRGRSGVFAAKVGQQQLYFLARYGIIPAVLGMPKFIHVRRRDVLAQAISFSIAAQTGSWTSRREESDEAFYDGPDIKKRVRAICQANARFQEFFAMFGIAPLELVYEDFADRLPEAVTTTVDWLGLGAADLDLSKIEIRQQRSQRNADWRERFIHEQRAYWGADIATGA